MTSYLYRDLRTLCQYLGLALTHWWQRRLLPEFVDVVREVRIEVPVEVRVEVEKRVEVPIELPCPHPGLWVQIPESITSILHRVKELVDESQRVDPHIQAGERKRHQVYGRLIKEFPFTKWKDLALAIELAIREVNAP